MLKNKMEKFDKIISLVDKLCMTTGLNTAHDYDGIENWDDVILYLESINKKLSKKGSMPRWRAYKDELPKDGQMIISYSKYFARTYPSLSGCIMERFNKDVRDKKPKKRKYNYWMPVEEIEGLLPFTATP